jgi:MFS superfamily sulfate permease-like transporter
VPGTDHWIPANIGRPTEQVAGVVAYLIYAPLWYGNADYFRNRVRTILDTAATPVRALVLDADGVSDIDYTGVRVVAEMVAELRQRRVVMAVARSSRVVHHALKHGALLEIIGPDRFFASVEEAVAAVTRSP